MTNELPRQGMKGTQWFKHHGYSHFTFQSPMRNLFIDDLFIDEIHDDLDKHGIDKINEPQGDVVMPRI